MFERKRIAVFLVACLALISGMSMTGLAKSRRMAVKVSKANVRSGPGTGYPVIWQMEKYTPVNVIYESNGWCRFRDFEGSEGWVAADLLGDIDTVIVRVKLCNIRTGPGTSFDIAFQAEKGVPFKVLKRKGKWIKIKHFDGDSGWIYKRLVW